MLLNLLTIVGQSWGQSTANNRISGSSVRLSYGHAAGSVKQKALPFASSLSAQILPPCASTSIRVM